MATMEVIDVEGDGDEFLQAAMADPEPKGKQSQKSEVRETKQVFKEMAKKSMTKEEVREHQAKIERVRRWLTHPKFKTHLEDNDYRYTARELRAMNMAELEELEERIRSCVDNRHPAQIITMAHQFGVNVLEGLSQKAPLNRYADLSGLSAIANGDDELGDILAILEINYGVVSIL